MQKQQSKKFNKSTKPNTKPNKPHSQPSQQFQKHKQIKKQHQTKTKGNEKLPTIQNMLEIPKEQRQNKSIVYFKKINPFLKSYIQKKQGSRVIHLIYKWGNPEIKQKIFKVIQQNWKQLIKSKYALHAISIASSDFQFTRIAEDAVLLQNNKQGATLLQNYLTKHPSSKLANQIYRKFDQINQKSKQNNFQSQQILHNLAMKSIQKQYYSNKISSIIIRYAFPTMIQEQKTKIIQFTIQNMLALLAHEQWVKLFINLYNYLDSKQKKNIVKQIKGKLGELLSASKISYVALIKILTQTDDTVFVGNKLVPQLMQSLTYKLEPTQMQNQNEQKIQGSQNQNEKPKIIQYPYLHKTSNILISLLSSRNNNFNCLGKIQRNVQFTTCKKPQQTRKQQVRQFVYPILIQYVVKQENIHKMCVDMHLSKLTLGLVKSLQADGSSLLKQFVIKFLKYYLQNLEEAKIGNSKKIEVSKTIAADNFGSKLLKNILLLQEPYIDKYADKFSQIFKNNLDETIHCSASFVMTVLIEKGRNQLIDQLRKSKININTARAADFYLQRLKGKAK